VPLLPVHNNNNRFSCLNVDAMSEGKEEEVCSDTPGEAKKTEKCGKLPKRKKWEKKLSHAYTIVTTKDTNSLHIKVQIKTMDTRQISGANGLVDCGVNRLFMGIEYVENNNIMPCKLTIPIRVNNVDGTPNENGPITEVADMVLDYNGHTEWVVFALTRLGGEDLILGLPWLEAHNLEIDWATGEVKMSRCLRKCRLC
jgi:hypothetical protein